VLSASYSGFVNGEQSNVLSGTPELSTSAGASSAVGSYPIVVSAGGLSAANYSFDFTNGTLSVAVASLTPHITASDKVYDRTAAASLSSQTLGGVTGSDEVSLVAGSASFDSKAVGNGRTVTAGGLSLGGSAAGNYILATNSATATASINPATVTPHIGAADKTYDGSDVATVTSQTLSGVIGGDEVSLVVGSARFDNRNAGNGKSVSGSSLGLSGADAGNYQLSPTTAGTTAAIHALEITVSAVTDSKVYDGTAGSAGVPAISPALVGGDSGNFTQSFDSKTAGSGKILTATGTVSDGNGGNNYAVSFAPDNTGDIRARALTVSAHGVSKVYDGTSGATVALSDNRVGGDVLSDSYAGASFDTKDAGTGKTVSVSGISVTGTDAGNYTFNTSASASADITRAALTVTADNKSRTYGLANPLLTASYNGFVNGEGINVLTTAVSLSTAANVSSAPGTYAITAGGGVAANYTISYVDGTLTVGSLPPLGDVSINGNQFIFTCPTVSGQTYQVEYKDGLNANNWSPLGNPVTGTGAPISFTNNIDTSTQRFFRLKILP
jgi:hypothetical protein